MKIAIYSRKSVETDKGESIKNQIEICKEYFLRRDNNIEFEIFEDEGFSGGNTNRPAF
ncbi:recombinase family protein [Clostridium botulinum]|nr:recombinase family protein [Clostridium botulinum D/C]QPW58639.1 recombinase family protein [Clostridium botulinum]MCD3239720.1 recombinase family protein [Clostridium botulinum D/C]MCD3267982.1 recombinase family protein [Clostridium botulinum D/C]MCD3299083.1 recombinase family protein [Clostridium botulinum D/C]